VLGALVGVSPGSVFLASPLLAAPGGQIQVCAPAAQNLYVADAVCLRYIETHKYAAVGGGQLNH
jgi:hypothetical protein